MSQERKRPNLPSESKEIPAHILKIGSKNQKKIDPITRAVQQRFKNEQFTTVAIDVGLEKVSLPDLESTMQKAHELGMYSLEEYKLMQKKLAESGTIRGEPEKEETQLYVILRDARMAMDATSEDEEYYCAEETGIEGEKDHYVMVTYAAFYHGGKMGIGKSQELPLANWIVQRVQEIRETDNTITTGKVVHEQFPELPEDAWHGYASQLLGDVPPESINLNAATKDPTREDLGYVAADKAMEAYLVAA